MLLICHLSIRVDILWAQKKYINQTVSGKENLHSLIETEYRIGERFLCKSKKGKTLSLVGFCDHKLGHCM